MINQELDFDAVRDRLLDAMLLLDEARDAMHEGLSAIGITPIAIATRLGQLDTMIDEMDAILGLSESAGI
jgi:hypothetical protein